MSSPFMPEQATAEIAFAETELGAALQAQSALVGARSPPRATIPRATERHRRLDSTPHAPAPGTTVDYRAVSQNLRSRLIGVIASLAWQDHDHRCTVLTGFPDAPEFPEPIRQRLVEQLGIAQRFVRADGSCETAARLAKDFGNWIRDNREDGGLTFEVRRSRVQAIAPSTAEVPL